MITRAILSFATMTALLPGQSPTWIRKDVRGICFGPTAVAFDSARSRLVHFFDGLWEWDGTAWTRRSSANAPSARAGHALAYDPVRRRTVLFGGGFPAQADTWEWDGADWQNRTPATSPPPSNSNGMVFDPVRQRVLLFTDSAQTWEWDGTGWTQRNPASSPAARMQFGMCWDDVRQRAVLFGGIDQNFTTTFGDVWEWNGSNWIAGATGVPARSGPGMAFDPGRRRVVVTGGMSASFNVLGDVWEYDGVQWTQEQATLQPQPITGAMLGYDGARQELVQFGGQTDTLGMRSDVWVRRCQNNCTGTLWQRRLGTQMPMVERGPAMVFDSVRSRFVLFGGSDNSNDTDDTWEWDGAAWSLRAPVPHPPARSWPAMAFDAARGRTVLFGGIGNFSPIGDTWTWDGSSWTSHSPASAPPVTGLSAMAFDSARAEVVLFGGAGTQAYHNQTWVWNGSTWTQRQPANSPPARGVHAMAYDTVRSRVVMFGGDLGSGLATDTWEWNGVDWAQRQPVNSPPPRLAHAMAFDPARNRVVLFGGEDGSFNYFGDTWDFDGVDWQQRTGPQPQGRSDHVMATDTVNGEVLMFSGFSSVILDPLWVLTPRRPAVAQGYGNGCGPGRLAAYGRPALGQLRFGLHLLEAPASAIGVIAASIHQASTPMLGCTLLIGQPVLAELALANASGFAQVHLAVPFNPALRGVDLYAQGLVLDGTTWSVAFTGGLRLSIGE